MRSQPGGRVSKLLAVSGLGLDRAWPSIGVHGGRQRRELAQRLLIALVGAARTANAEAILIVGDLLDRRTVMPNTVTLIARAFASFPGRVLVAPGRGDWHSTNGPFGTGDWDKNTHIWQTTAFAAFQVDDSLLVRGSAWTSASPQSLAWPEDPAVRGRTLLVRAGEADSEHTPDSVPGAHLVTSGARRVLHSDYTVLGPLLPEIGGKSGQAVVIEVHGDGHVSQQPIVVFDDPSDTVVIDVTPEQSQSRFDSAIRSAIASASPFSLVQVIGMLTKGILLPDFSGFELGRADIVLDCSRLQFEAPEPNHASQDTQTEFLRGILDSDEPDEVQHQVVALGLKAFEANQ